MRFLKLSLCSLLLLLTVLLSGCWDQYELRELSVVTGLGIDLVDDETIRLTIQVINPSELASQEEGTGRSSAQNYETFAPTIQEAFRKLTEKAPRRGYYSHIASVVIGESAARAGLTNFLDHFYRDHEIRTDFPIVIARGYEAKEILSVIPPIEEIASIHIMNSISYGENSYSLVTATTLDDLFEKIVGPGIDPYLNGITINGDETVSKQIANVEEVKPIAFLQLGDMAIFREDQLVGWLTEEETKGLLYLTGNIQDTSETLPCPHGQEGSFVVETYSTKTTMDINYEGDELNVNIDPEIHGTISEVNCEQLDITSKESHAYIHDALEQKINELISETLARARDEHVDFTGIGREVYREQPTYWKTIRQDWYEAFTQANIEVHTEGNVVESGDVNNTFNIEDYKHDH
ncbi:Ger(x)C family spore germination protein [Geomicrobium sp. JCM 19038]|uniref:Ger(x)C family spore germination protein n=1 Tax=Geomicrobium sp. JCM 19038 TaxID=1460635 RepID=UPI00045F45C1|nr:Ger(x)C family spore germination protein [Geomicrobium sp. JCM 19038]GAK08545.1 hypothetical protein JCM19038_2330 [Geomicrobium sp. JCM 19038]